MVGQFEKSEKRLEYRVLTDGNKWIKGKILQKCYIELQKQDNIVVIHQVKTGRKNEGKTVSLKNSTKKLYWHQQKERVTGMKYEKVLKIKKEHEEVYKYYVVKNTDNEFGCDMYNVGIVKNNTKKEIENFSPSLTEAKRLCDYLYNENISINNLFSAAEEFITCLGI